MTAHTTVSEMGRMVVECFVRKEMAHGVLHSIVYLENTALGFSKLSCFSAVQLEHHS